MAVRGSFCLGDIDPTGGPGRHPSDETPQKLSSLRIYPQTADRASSIAGLVVDAALTTDGDLIISGQDLDRSRTPGGDEYEYAITIASADVAVVAAALGGSAADILDLLFRSAPLIVETGEMRWLHQLGLAPTLSSWS